MKKGKSDSGKPAKKAKKKSAKKELESGISQRFLDAIAALGEDTDRIARDIKKMSKQLTEKLAESIKQIKKENKQSAKKKKRLKDETDLKGKKSTKAEEIAALSKKKDNSKPRRTSAKISDTQEVENVIKPVTRRARNARAATTESANPAPVARRRRNTSGVATPANSKPTVRRTRKTTVAPKSVDTTDNNLKSDVSVTEPEKGTVQSQW